MSFDVAPCADLAEFGDAVFAIGQYFGMEQTEERIERFSRNLPIERMHAVREDGKTVGGGGAFPFEMTVPGAVVPTAGVTVVGTYPTHRRRGVLRALMRAQLDDIHEREEPVAALWASEETIYGRFGYGMASLTGNVTIPRQHSGFATPLEREGRVRLVEADEALKLFPRVWDSVRKQIPGMLGRTRNWWEFRMLFDPGGGEGGPKRYAVLERDGRPEGYALYRHVSKWTDDGPDSRIDVVEAVALDGRPTAELWRYLLDIDWAVKVTAGRLPVDHQLFWLLARPREMRFRLWDALWVRLVDIGAALSARELRGGRRRGLRRRGRVLPVEHRYLAALERGREALEGAGPAPLRRHRARLGLPRRVLVLRARPRRPRRGAPPRRSRARGRDVRVAASPVVPRDLLAQQYLRFCLTVHTGYAYDLVRGQDDDRHLGESARRGEGGRSA